MGDILQNFISPEGFMPHGHCYLWTPNLLWTYVFSDALIGLAYYSIPVALFYFTRKREDLVFNWMFKLFGIFILACGTTHFFSIITIWHPVYWLDANIKAATALSSVVTAILLWPLIPRALKLPSPKQLEMSNEALEKEILQRNEAERALRKAYDELEQRIAERTLELSQANEKLQQEIEMRKQAEKSLASHTQNLIRSNIELQRFAYVASHDLQEPLRMVSNYVEFLRHRYRDKLGPDANVFIDFIVNGATRMRQLINDMLAYSRVDTQEKKMQMVKTEQVLRQTLLDLQLSIKEHRAVITYDTLPEIQGDEIQLLQLFQNLIGNAIKFRGKDLPKVHVTAQRNQTEWLFSVKDNGIGMAAEYTDKIFVLFQRLHTKDEYPGTGIGLAICKKIVERHGGRIWVESVVDQGSTFYFTLPFTSEAE